jgi:hypothetical protein
MRLAKFSPVISKKLAIIPYTLLSRFIMMVNYPKLVGNLPNIDYISKILWGICPKPVLR